MPEIPEQIIFRLDNKKMVYSERFDWPKIEITMLWSEICLHLGLSFCCLAWSNRFQVRDQEDAEHRDVRLATDRDRHSLVRVLLFGFCTRMVSMLILPRREITNLAHESWSDFLLFGMVKSFSGARSRRC